MDRIDLPSPMSANDIYMHDQCISLRTIADLLAALVAVKTVPPPPPPPAYDVVVPLREPAPEPEPAPAKPPKAAKRDKATGTL